MCNDYCKCKNIKSITTEECEHGYWDICCQRIEGGFHYYNHYDGEDHDDIDILND